MITRFIDLSLFGFLEEINASFRRFGSLAVDWPHKAESKSYFPPKGYAFLLFQVLLLYYQLLSYKFLNIFFYYLKEENSVQQLIETCIQEEDKLYLCVSSPTIKVKSFECKLLGTIHLTIKLCTLSEQTGSDPSVEVVGC